MCQNICAKIKVLNKYVKISVLNICAKQMCQNISAKIKVRKCV